MRTTIAAVCIGALLTAAGPGAAQTAAPPTAAPAGLVKGEIVPPLDAEGIDGVMKHVGYPKGSTTVLLFFLSSCPTCHKMIPLWNRAYERRSRGVEVFGVMLDHESPGFFMATPISFPVLRAPDRTPAERKAFVDGFKIQHVPVTLRLGQGGVVQDVSQGFIDAIKLGELFAP